MAIAGACTALLDESWAVLAGRAGKQRRRGDAADRAWHDAARGLFARARKRGTVWSWFLAGKAGNHGDNAHQAKRWMSVYDDGNQDRPRQKTLQAMCVLIAASWDAVCAPPPRPADDGDAAAEAGELPEALLVDVWPALNWPDWMLDEEMSGV